MYKRLTALRKILEPLTVASSNSTKFLPTCGKISCNFSTSTDSEKFLVNSPYSHVDVPEITIPQLIWHQLDKWPDHIALQCGITGKKYTYAQLRKVTRNFASSLIKLGLKQGDVVAIVLPNFPEFAIAILGALEAGLVVSTINPIYNSDEIKYQIGSCEAKCVITFSEKVFPIQKSLEKLRRSVPILTVPTTEILPVGALNFDEFIQKPADERILGQIKPVNWESLAILPYSSGTTGLPKGVRLTHKNIVWNIFQFYEPQVRLALPTTNDYQDVSPSVLPFFHIYGMTVGLFSYLRLGVKLITLPKFEPQSFLNSIFEQKATMLHVVPPLVQFLGNHPMVKPEHLQTVRIAVNGAASVSVSDAEKLQAKKQMNIISGYGMTETSPAITMCKNTCKDLRTVGSPLYNSQVKIANTETGEAQDPSTPGEICVRGPQVMEGYHNNENATNETIRNGWLHTGDVGYFDDKVQLFIVDRMKELIKVKGFQVAPLELEEVLKTHPNVADVGVVGKVDERSGETPVAFVVAKNVDKQSEDELKKYVAEKVAEYKRLGEVRFIKEIPKNTTGKILRKKLREMLKS